MNESEQKPKARLDLSALSNEEVEKLVSTRSDHLVEAEREYWEAACEALVREVKAAWPNAKYLGLNADANQYGEFWSLEAVYDETGGVLADFEIDQEGFSQFEESFVNEYRHVYTQEFGIDDANYFDLETRTSMTEREYNKNIAGKAV